MMRDGTSMIASAGALIIAVALSPSLVLGEGGRAAMWSAKRPKRRPPNKLPPHRSRRMPPFSIETDEWCALGATGGCACRMTPGPRERTPSA